MKAKLRLWTLSPIILVAVCALTVLSWKLGENSGWAVEPSNGNSTTFAKLEQTVGVPTGADPQTQPLLTRWFKLDPTRVANRYAGDSFFTNFLSYLKEAGADLRPPKNLFYNERDGMLMVRGTQMDLKVVEKSIQDFKRSPAAGKATASLRLEVNIVEYPEEKGLDVFRLMGLADSPAGVTIDTPRVPHTGPLPEKPSTITTGVSSSEMPLTWILTKSLNEFILDKLSQSADAQVIAGPRILASAGERAKVEFDYPGKIVTHLGHNQNPKFAAHELEAFPTLYVEPDVKGDGHTIHMKTTQAITDLVAYHLGGTEDVWDYVESSGANPSPDSTQWSIPSNGKPKPIYHSREATSSASLRDGETLVLSGLTATAGFKTNVSAQNKVPLLGDLPLAGRLFRAHTIPPEKKKLLVFITPTLVGEDGKPIHEQAPPEGTALTPVK